ncbi:hypothetical protein O6H91_19G024200 [Diphasiastrum complanatum]|uniref:Uncharacterized protein n=1 Tax=Diphasiastrum complanatum TaxID=34168 RepID=A0ACC2ATR4_DIPCM|nr:hypothetical protein O6H91_19G024200 [Diphasiastrum complanatum]
MQFNTFIARSDLKRPPGKIAFGLAETGKPKLRGNLSAEVKIKRLSVSILDDLSGMMIPLLDTTVTDINLAAHGRPEALNVVAVCSMAASTFNTQLEAWEPLIEPFEGIVKYEYNDVNSETALKVRRGVRITTANIVNMNITCAGIEALVGALLAWQKRSEVEEQAQIAIQMEENDYKDPAGAEPGAALEHDDLEKMIIYNNLYCDLFLRTFSSDYEKVEVLSSGKSSLVDLPPLKYPIKLTRPLERRSPFHFVVVHISEAKNLALRDDICNQEILCALRMVNSKDLSEDQKALLQSARSRAVKPCTLSGKKHVSEVSAKWNEAFIFEVPPQGLSTLEIVVTNLSAKGGKGEAVGTLSLPIKNEHGQRISNSSALWKLLFQSINQGSSSSWPTAQTKVVSLNSPNKQGIGAEHQTSSCGELAIRLYYFTMGTNWHATNETGNDESQFKDLALWFGLTPHGPWETLRSTLSQGVIPKVVNGQKIAIEATIIQGRKHVSFRSLATIRNNSDVALEICVCPVSLLNYRDESASSGASKTAVFLEECFENQRYQPLAGWGSKWPGHLMPTDPGRWSTRDYSRSSQEFLDVPLAPGWIWTSDWKVDHFGNVDNEGWFYGPDFQSLRWPPQSPKASKKSTFDFTRRRRWIRTRQRVPEDKHARTRKNLGALQPANSMSLPLASTGAETDFCVQVRPCVDTSEDEYLWGRAVRDLKSAASIRNPDAGQSAVRKPPQLTKGGVPVSAFMLNQLEKTDELLLCVAANTPGRKGHTWLNMEADASILYTELNEAVYDWKLSVNAPLKLENLLPCNAEYIVWEKGSGANPVKQQHGVVSAGGAIYVCTVDIRKPIYLTWLAQGSWKLPKEAVVISDPALEELPLHFWMQHQQSGRRLRVSLEYDYGSTNVAAKTVRLFVPYWLCNDANLPLAFRLVEIEPAANTVADSSWLQRAAKATKQTSYPPSHAGERGKLSLHKVIKTLDIIEDSYAAPIMLSLQSELECLGSSSQPRSDEGSLMLRLGLSVAISNSNVFSHGLCFRDFEDSKDQVDIKAIDAQGGYYRLSAQLDMTSERTKVVHIQPHTIFINRLGRRLHLRQADCRHDEFLYPNDPPKTILWCTTQEPEILKISLEGHKWSQPFSVENEGVMHVTLWDEFGNSRFTTRVEVRNGVKGSRILVIFRQVSAHGPYRIENRSVILPFRFRQVDSSYESWQLLQTGSTLPFAWEDLQRERLLEILVDGADPLTSRAYNIDEIADHQPMPTKGGPVAALHVTVSREKGMQVVRVADWMPSDDILAILPFRLPSMFPAHTPEKDSPRLLEGCIADDSENQFLTVIELAEFGVSVVDHTPEELLYISLQNFVLSYATGLGSHTTRFKVRVDGLQVDNQLPLTPMPVLFTSRDPANEAEFVLKCTLTMKNQGMLDQYRYPYIGIQGPNTSNMCFLINIHEPIIWRLHDMFQNLNLSRLTSSQTTAVALDPIIHIGLLSTTDFRFKVTLAMSPTQRPRGILGFWSTLLTSLGNTDDMQIRITPHLHEEICMRQSALVAAAIASIRNDILSQPLRLLSGVDLLGNASSALGHMSKGIAALSMDKKFIRSRQRQESKANVDHLGDGIREGGEALAKSLFRGVTGILTKPLEGARSSGVEGFIQGVGKGVIGAAVQPMSGILDLLSKTTEGANATRIKLSAVLTSEEQLMRRRLPRVICGDNVLRPYDEYKAQGQVLLQLAHRGAFFGHMDFFKVRGKFAWSDAYEDHFHLPKGRTLIVTHRRVILLQHPTGLIVQKKPDLLKDACTILWDVTWNDILSMELIRGKKDPLHSPPSRLVINLRNSVQDSKLFDSRENIRVVKCHPGSKQAYEVRSAVQQAYDAYGPNRTQVAAQFYGDKCRNNTNW